MNIGDIVCKVVREEKDGKLLSAIAGHPDGSHGFQALEYREGYVTAAPFASNGIYVCEDMPEAKDGYRAGQLGPPDAWPGFKHFVHEATIVSFTPGHPQQVEAIRLGRRIGPWGKPEEEVPPKPERRDVTSECEVEFLSHGNYYRLIVIHEGNVIADTNLANSRPSAWFVYESKGYTFECHPDRPLLIRVYKEEA